MLVAMLLLLILLVILPYSSVSESPRLTPLPLAPSRLQVEGLNCEQLDSDPFTLTCGSGIDTPTPRFSFFMNCVHGHAGDPNPNSATCLRDIIQTGYQLQVFESQTGKLLWDTTEVSSMKSTLVTFEGEYPLESDTSYSWRVRTWGKVNSVGSDFDSISFGPSPWSLNAYFDVAFVRTPNSNKYSNPIPTAKWIGAPSTSPSLNLFRVEFEIQDPKVSRGRIYVCALGYFRLFVNGVLASLNRLDPAWTDYRHRCVYVSIDVTSVLQTGENALGIEVGNGWFGMKDGLGMQRVLLMEARVNGKVVVQSSDDVGIWKAGAGPVTMDSIYNGETYDARVLDDIRGWSTVGFNDSTWVNVVDKKTEMQNMCTILSVQSIPPIRQMQVLKAKRITQPGKGIYVIDFEQNLSGWCRFTLMNNLTFPRGTVISLHHAEILQDDGFIYTKNLRSALATDTYTFRGIPGESWEPTFTYHGFRFVQIEGWPAPGPQLSEIVAVHAYSSVSPAGDFSVDQDNLVLNQVQHNIRWGQQCNLMSVPTDCDQRDERLGWMADGHLSAQEAIRNFDMLAFYEMWTKLMHDDQGPTGGIADVVPMMRYSENPGDPSWAAAFLEVPMFLWEQYGDSTLFTELYPSLKKYVDFLTADWETDHRDMKNFPSKAVHNVFGDWVPPPPAKKCSVHLTAGFYFMLNVRDLITMAKVLENQKDVYEYTSLYADLVKSFNQAFYSDSPPYYDIGVQTALSLPLFLGDVVDTKVVENVTRVLLNDISTHEYHLTTGIIGTKYLPLVLSRIGRTDVALRLATQFTYPSWGYMYYQTKETPATTLWELWNAEVGNPGMDSRNHIMFGSIEEWLFDWLAGLQVDSGEHELVFRQDSSSVQPNTFVLRPPPAGVILLSAVRSAQASRNVTTNNLGEVSISWQRRGGRVCAHAPENHAVVIDCGKEFISDVLFASYGLPYGPCGGSAMSSCHASTSLAVARKDCVGKTSCSVMASNTVFGDPCLDKWKRMTIEAFCGDSSKAPTLQIEATVPENSVAEVSVSQTSLVRDSLVIQEGNVVVWKNGIFEPGVTGVHSAKDDGVGNVVFQVGSGSYVFETEGVLGSTSCAIVPEHSVLHLQCPSARRISSVRFGSYGTPVGQCSQGREDAQTLAVGSCDAGSSVHVIEKFCLWKESCSIPAEDSLFNDPCFGTVKKLAVSVFCT